MPRLVEVFTATPYIKYKETYPQSEAFSEKEEERNGSLISMVDGVHIK